MPSDLANILALALGIYLLLGAATILRCELASIADVR